MIMERNAVRAILLTSEAEVLLMRIRRPESGDFFWILPGGGLEPRETAEAGLRRELKEELGIEDFLVGPLLWRRQHTFTWAGKRICQREEHYAVPIPRFKPRISDAVEAQTVDRFHWWPLAGLTQATESVAPIALARIIADYLAYGAPQQPLEMEILVD